MIKWFNDKVLSFPAKGPGFWDPSVSQEGDIGVTWQGCTGPQGLDRNATILSGNRFSWIFGLGRAAAIEAKFTHCSLDIACALFDDNQGQSMGLSTPYPLNPPASTMSQPSKT